MRPALVLLAVTLIGACGTAGPAGAPAPAPAAATVAGEELTLDIPELL